LLLQVENSLGKHEVSQGHHHVIKGFIIIIALGGDDGDDSPATVSHMFMTKTSER
jgi:hypothetical protein